MTPSGVVSLREVEDADIDIFFEHYRDPDGQRMAAFTSTAPDDRPGFDKHWSKIRGNATILIRTILLDGAVAGHIASFTMMGDRDVTYWIDKKHWGKGVASQALARFLSLERTRPLYGRAAKDNKGSLRVLEKCGFKVTGEASGFANARGAEIPELVLTLT